MYVCVFAFSYLYAYLSISIYPSIYISIIYPTIYHGSCINVKSPPTRDDETCMGSSGKFLTQIGLNFPFLLWLALPHAAGSTPPSLACTVSSLHTENFQPSWLYLLEDHILSAHFRRFAFLEYLTSGDHNALSSILNIYPTSTHQCWNFCSFIK